MRRSGSVVASEIERSHWAVGFHRAWDRDAP